jgi:hypothetical protein
MKKIISSGLLKNIGYILGYWVIFVIMPFLSIYLIKHSYRYNNMPIEAAIYTLFIAPFLYFIPYLLVRPKRKLLFILWGLLVPYLLLYLFIYLDFRINFHLNF